MYYRSFGYTCFYSAYGAIALEVEYHTMVSNRKK